MVRSQHLKAVPLDCRALADQLGCSYESVVRIVGSFADGPRTWWSWQAKGFFIFERHRRHKTAKCGHPQFWLMSRHGWDRVGGEAGTVRARLRQKTAILWIAHVALLKKLAFGLIIRGREAANDKHKGSPSRGTGGARQGRSPPAENRPAWRRFGKVAADLQEKFDLASPLRVSLHGWAVQRLAHWHSRERILACLLHAAAVMPQGRFAPINEASWLCGVATYHLEADGLGRKQRHRDLQQEAKRHGAGAPTFRVKSSKSEPDFVDADGVRWQHLGGTDWKKML